jgi:hypothetical protein
MVALITDAGGGADAGACLGWMLELMCVPGAAKKKGPESVSPSLTDIVVGGTGSGGGGTEGGHRRRRRRRPPQLKCCCDLGPVDGRMA